MGLRYNPFTCSFDLTRSPGSYLDGEVATYADLPLDTAAAPLNSAWLVRAGSGLWLLTRKPAGIYIRTATGGTDRDADYTYAGTFPDVFSDANFTLYDDADSTKNAKFQLSGISTGTTRTLTVPDASGTLPLLETANTFSQNQTLNGTNNVAPNQTAASGSSIMTRDLGDARYGGQTLIATAAGVLLTQNNTTLENITGMSLTLPTGTYIITTKVFFSANASAGSKMAMTFSGTSTQQGFRQTITTSVVQAVAIGSFISTSSATAAETEHFRVYFCDVTAQGTLQVQGAQNVAGLNNIAATGFLKAEKIA